MGGPTGLGFRLVESARKRQASPTRTQAWGSPAATTAATDCPICSSATRAVRPTPVYRAPARRGAAFTDVRSDFAPVFGTNFTGWGDSWVDLNRDGILDLVLANGAIPVTNIARDAGQIQVLDNLSAQRQDGKFGDAGGLLGLRSGPFVNGRGVAAADFNNDGNIDIAVNTIDGPLVLLENTNTSGHWLEVSLDGFHPGALLTAVLPNGRSLVRETARRQQLPLLRGPAGVLRARRRDEGVPADRALPGRPRDHRRRTSPRTRSSASSRSGLTGESPNRPSRSLSRSARRTDGHLLVCLILHRRRRESSSPTRACPRVSSTTSPGAGSPAAASRALVFLNFPTALIAIAIVAIVFRQLPARP